MVDSNAKPLLSRSTAVLRINANYVAGEDEFRDRLVDKFPKLWDGIGCLRGQPKYNRVPFHRREKVEKEIQKLVDADIIERVTDGPTEWVSRIVNPSKPKKQTKSVCAWISRGLDLTYLRPDVCVED